MELKPSSDDLDQLAHSDVILNVNQSFNFLFVKLCAWQDTINCVTLVSDLRYQKLRKFRINSQLRRWVVPGIRNFVLSSTGNCFSPQNLSMMQGTCKFTFQCIFHITWCFKEDFRKIPFLKIFLKNISPYLGAPVWSAPHPSPSELKWFVKNLVQSSVQLPSLILSSKEEDTGVHCTCSQSIFSTPQTLDS